MTEEEWFGSDDLKVLVPFCDAQLTERQKRLIAIAACRAVPTETFSDKHLALLRIAEQVTERPGTKLKSAKLRARLHGAWPYTEDVPDDANIPTTPHALIAHLFNASLLPALLCASVHEPCNHGNMTRVSPLLAGLVRDVVGNPFRPVAFDPAWRTSTAVALARQMYDSREFSAMPILADALQDAGCEDEAILNHCRDANQPHVRGCWVCDLVLGKE